MSYVLKINKTKYRALDISEDQITTESSSSSEALGMLTPASVGLYDPALSNGAIDKDPLDQPEDGSSSIPRPAVDHPRPEVDHHRDNIGGIEIYDAMSLEHTTPSELEAQQKDGESCAAWQYVADERCERPLKQSVSPDPPPPTPTISYHQYGDTAEQFVPGTSAGSVKPVMTIQPIPQPKHTAPAKPATPDSPVHPVAWSPSSVPASLTAWATSTINQPVCAQTQPTTVVSTKSPSEEPNEDDVYAISLGIWLTLGIIATVTQCIWAYGHEDDCLWFRNRVLSVVIIAIAVHYLQTIFRCVKLLRTPVAAVVALVVICVMT